jgi:hypothetical protein
MSSQQTRDEETAAFDECVSQLPVCALALRLLMHSYVGTHRDTHPHSPTAGTSGGASIIIIIIIIIVSRIMPNATAL